MAYRSDTNNRNVPNTWNITILDGEISGYDRGMEIQYGDLTYIEDSLSGLDVEAFETKKGAVGAVKLLYKSDDFDHIRESLI